ncbi:MAG TPA: cytochrome c peroxidase [Saprospiraceae bacterium]|nr:cytochrome c peroxidase [Saprospiraceae bacterium]
MKDRAENELVLEGSHSDAILNPAQLLGKKLFFDTLLSNPAGQSCASCHMPKMSFTDPEGLPVSRGAMKTMFGNRNSPTVAYAAFTPYFHYDSIDQGYIGGLFWDGRAATLEEQAKTPLLTQHEMNNADKNMVVEHLMKAEYKDLFLSVYGQNAFDDKEKAFEYLAEAIEEYEETPEISPFSSKFDFYIKGQAQLTDEELRGMKIFNDTLTAKCASCHPTTPDPYTNAILFTDYTYDNLGIPANPELIKLDKNYKRDLGLGAIVKQTTENGKFKVSTLRNIANTAPYFHNGVFKTLEEVMQFYNSRNTGKFGPPEVAENVNQDELGDLKLTDQEMKDVIAFLKTLTDGYSPEVIVGIR